MNLPTRIEMVDAIRTFALTFPGAHEDFPWGERVIKVDKKIFLFAGSDQELDRQLAFSVKLPQSALDALELPAAKPTGYGLGKSGWVTFAFTNDLPPLSILHSWIEESYQAVATKRRWKEWKEHRHRS